MLSRVILLDPALAWLDERTVTSRCCSQDYVRLRAMLARLATSLSSLEPRRVRHLGMGDDI